MVAHIKMSMSRIKKQVNSECISSKGKKLRIILGANE